MSIHEAVSKLNPCPYVFNDSDHIGFLVTNELNQSKTLKILKEQTVYRNLLIAPGIFFCFEYGGCSVSSRRISKKLSYYHY